MLNCSRGSTARGRDSSGARRQCAGCRLGGRGESTRRRFGCRAQCTTDLVARHVKRTRGRLARPGGSRRGYRQCEAQRPDDDGGNQADRANPIGDTAELAKETFKGAAECLRENWLAGRCHNEANPRKCQDQHESKSCGCQYDERRNQTAAPVGRDEARNTAEDQAKQNHTPGDRSNLRAELNQAECRSGIGNLREFGCSGTTYRRSQFRVDPVKRLLDHLRCTLDPEDERSGIWINEDLLKAHERLREDVLEGRLSDDR